MEEYNIQPQEQPIQQPAIEQPKSNKIIYIISAVTILIIIAISIFIFAPTQSEDDQLPPNNTTSSSAATIEGDCLDTKAKKISDSIINTIIEKDKSKYETTCQIYGEQKKYPGTEREYYDTPCLNWDLSKLGESNSISLNITNDEEKQNRKWVVYNIDTPKMKSMQFIFNLSKGDCSQFNIQFTPK